MTFDKQLLEHMIQQPATMAGPSRKRRRAPKPGSTAPICSLQLLFCQANSPMKPLARTQGVEVRRKPRGELSCLCTLITGICVLLVGALAGNHRNPPAGGPGQEPRLSRNLQVHPGRIPARSEPPVSAPAQRTTPHHASSSHHRVGLLQLRGKSAPAVGCAPHLRIPVHRGHCTPTA